jgi:hypothetical protein
LVEEKKVVDPALASFYEAMEKTNTKKITNEMLAGLSEDSGDSENFDVESGDEDAEDRLWRPSHTIFRKSSIKQSQIDAMKGRYFHDMSIVRAGGDSAAPAPVVDEVVVYRSFMKAGHRFPLSKFLVEVLKTFEIFLHQITPEAIIRMGIFIWAMRSQGLEPSAKWFYVKNNSAEREDIKRIIQRPIWSRFGTKGRLLLLETISKHARRLSTMHSPLLAHET